MSIFLFVTEIQSRKHKYNQQVICLSSCGDIKNISYPNKTILEFHSGKYNVKNISYNAKITHVVDVNLAGRSCGLPYKSLSINELVSDIRYTGYVDTRRRTASFVNCSRNINDTGYIEVPRLSGDRSYVYVMLGGHAISLLPEPCFFVSMVPILDPDVNYSSYVTIQNLLKSGFDLGWSVECRNSIAAGGFCFHLSVQKPYTYRCSKSGFIFKYIFAFLISYLLVMVFISRIIAIPIVLIGFSIHKYKTTRKTVDNANVALAQLRGFGSVYKGQLIDGGLIAIKVLENSKFSAEEFTNEVSTIGRIHHVNVVRLLGFCYEGSKRALFSKKDTNELFSWEKLHEIALGTARGIEYLHEGCDVCILHFDIKPHNMLLDYNFIPKVAYFGLAKFYPKENNFVCVSALRGTIGYIAPELISKNFNAVSSKSDVYIFGMLLLEMAGGRRNSFAKATRSSKLLRNVSEIESVIARKLCIIGLWCIQVKATDRPSITKVVEMLEGNIDDLQKPPKPLFSSSSQQSSIKQIQSDSQTELLESESIEEC
ncbi:hypothetical protein ACOSQ3_019974 [Xanthoceras sorbifolium]